MQKDIINYLRGLLSWSDLNLIAYAEGYTLHRDNGRIYATR